MIQLQIAAAVWAIFSACRLLYDPWNFYHDTLGTLLAFSLISPKALTINFRLWRFDLGKYGHYIFSGIGYAISCILAYFVKGLLSHGNDPWKSATTNEKGGEKSIMEEPFKPLIFPARTTHTRLFPKHHSFSYSYLLVGVPVGLGGNIGGSFLSVDAVRASKGWFNIQNKDYLHRGCRDSLKQKLDQYLKLQNKELRSYAHVYLVTAPRFLGYAFNPVSFWYLYDEKQVLAAMILEVNNTFDERRMYFLEGDMPSSTGESAVEEKGVCAESRRSTFLNRWSKDFHVSPFNSRKGSYSLAANDPFSGLPAIDNTITLLSSKHHAKLVARIFSTSRAMDPATMSTVDKARFILSWWWVGFVTFPRIVREAGKLFWKKGLHVWFRPEVLPGSISRNVTKEERIIEGVFRQWLLELMKSAGGNWLLRYMTPEETAMFAEPDASSGYSNIFKKKCQVFGPTGAEDVEDDASCNIIDLKIITPQFYSNLAVAADLEQFLKDSFMKENTSNAQLIRCSDPDVFLDLLHRNSKRNSRLRPFFGKDRHHSGQECKKAIFKLYISEIVFCGTPVPLLDWLEWGLRCCLYVLVAWACTKVMYVCLLELDEICNIEVAKRWVSVLEPMVAIQIGSFKVEGMTSNQTPSMGWFDALKVTVMLCSVHIWWALKELLRYVVVDL